MAGQEGRASDVSSPVAPKKKKDPSDVNYSFALRRHARHRAIAIGLAERVASQLPNGCFRHPPDQCILARCQTAPDQDRSLVTAFRSSAAAALSLSLHHEVNVPGLPLRFLPRAITARSDPSSTTTSGLRQTRLLQRMNPVAAPAHGTNSCSAGQPPLRDCYLPRDRKQNRPGLYSARLPNPPDSLSLPDAVSIARFGFGSSFQSRYVSGGLLFLKPLGTSFTMLPKSFRVNPFCVFSKGFPQSLFALFRTGYSGAP